MAKKAEEEAQNTNGWITTYTDLMILLLTFFVLLISISVMDSRKKRIALDSLVGAFGFKPGGHSVIGKEKGINITVGASPLTKEEIDFERLRNIAFKNNLQADVKVQMEGEKIIIGLSHRVLFDKGSSRLTEQGRKFLMEITPVLRDSPGLVELRGYVDPSEVLFSEDRTKDSMLLSANRAASVYRFLNANGKIPKKKLVAHGFGIQDIKQGAVKVPGTFNRQVEIILDYRATLPFRVKKGLRKEKLLLDFKGFLFKLKGGEDG